MNNLFQPYSNQSHKHFNMQKIPPLAYIFLSFALVILIGSLLLFIPYASSDTSNSLSYMDAFFLSVSSVCVTGLSPVSSIGDSLSTYGKIVIACLIQIGGLGLVTIVSFIIVMTGKRLNMATATVVKESLNQSGFKMLKKLLKHIIIITIVFELAGAILNFVVFSRDYPFWEAVGISVFHSISAFNNAGFDIIGSSSLQGYTNDVLLNLTTCFLILGGGLGFLVYEDIFMMKRWRRFSIQTRLVLLVNGGIAVISFLLIKAMEGDKITWLQAFFYSVNLRTAGFSTFDLKSSLNTSTAVFSMMLMLIGGSPLSTAGGIKTTTVYVLFATVFAAAMGKKPHIYKREISKETVRKAFVLFSVSVFDIAVGALLISIFEGNTFDFLDIIYECFSAFGTVGVSMGITTKIGIGSKIVLCLLMYFGRLGPVTLITIFVPLFKNKANEVIYLSTDLSIG